MNQILKNDPSKREKKISVSKYITRSQQTKNMETVITQNIVRPFINDLLLVLKKSVIVF